MKAIPGSNMTKFREHSINSPVSYTYAALFLLILIDRLEVFVESRISDNSTISQNIIDSQSLDESVQVKLNEFNLLRNTCDRAEEDLDRCSAQLIAFGAKEPLLPVNMSELESVYCPNFKRIVKCLKNNANCYKPFQRQIINWILTSTRKMNHKRCKNESEKLRFLKLTNSCMSVMKNPADRCMTNYIAQVDAIANLSQDSKEDIQIQLSCCANKRFKECVMKQAKHVCKPIDILNQLRRTNSVSSSRIVHKRIQRSMQDMMEDLRSTLDSMTLTGPEFICQSVDERFCRKRFDGKYDGPALHKSIVPGMLKIYSNKP